MLSIEQCRKYLGDNGSSMTEQEVDELKNLLYQLANVLVDGFLEGKDLKNGDSKTDRSK